MDGEDSVVAADAYQNVIRQLFQQAEIVVSEDHLDRDSLTPASMRSFSVATSTETEVSTFG
jgi:hypothetical protein